MEVVGEELGNFNSLVADFLGLAFVVVVIIVILVRERTIFYALGVPVALVYGFTVASEQDVYSPLWVAGVTIGILGLYFLYQIAMGVVGEIRKRR